jgi:hypothetical protein
MSGKQLHESGLNIIENPDGSFAFEWNSEDERWSWMNDLTDQEIKVIIEELIKNPQSIEELFNGE